MNLDEIRKKAKYTQVTMISPCGTEWRDLQCPKCGCDKIVVEKPDLGRSARCYECGHKFIITENCYVFTRWGKEKLTSSI